MTSFTLNGKKMEVTAEADTPLLWVIRDEAGLTGTKFGCGIGMCGACTVHIGGKAARSCVTPVSAVEGAEITTIEGLDPEGPAPGPESLAGIAGPAMRLLPVRPDHAGRRRAQGQPQHLGRRHRRADVRQSLPLHDLHPHPRRRASGRQRHEGGLIT